MNNVIYLKPYRNDVLSKTAGLIPYRQMLKDMTKLEILERWMLVGDMIHDGDITDNLMAMCICEESLEVAETQEFRSMILYKMDKIQANIDKYVNLGKCK